MNVVHHLPIKVYHHRYYRIRKIMPKISELNASSSVGKHGESRGSKKLRISQKNNKKEDILRTKKNLCEEF